MSSESILRLVGLASASKFSKFKRLGHLDWRKIPSLLCSYLESILDFRHAFGNLKCSHTCKAMVLSSFSFLSILVFLVLSWIVSLSIQDSFLQCLSRIVSCPFLLPLPRMLQTTVHSELFFNHKLTVSCNTSSCS